MSRIPASGTPLGATTLSAAGIDAETPAVAVHSSNRMLVAWEGFDGANVRIEYSVGSGVIDIGDETTRPAGCQRTRRSRDAPGRTRRPRAHVLRDVDAATIRFTHQVDRSGARVPLKTEESKATLPLPRAAAVMLLEHKARSLHSGARSFVFATRTGKAISQRDVLRALYRAQQRARHADGRPTFPELFERDRRGQLIVDDEGAYVPRRVKRRELNLPDFHALRHGAAMACDDAEEARDLRHKNSNVTRTIYRAHFDDRRRESLRARMESRMENEYGRTPQRALDRPAGEAIDMQGIRSTAQQTAAP